MITELTEVPGLLIRKSFLILCEIIYFVGYSSELPLRQFLQVLTNYFHEEINKIPSTLGDTKK